MEEVVFSILVVGIPIGWFLRSAAQWRRDAKRNRTEISPPSPAASPPTPVEPRVERLLERLVQRMETLEDRIDFTERLLDARGTPVRPQGLERRASAFPEAPARR